MLMRRKVTQARYLVNNSGLRLVWLEGDGSSARSEGQWASKGDNCYPGRGHGGSSRRRAAGEKAPERSEQLIKRACNWSRQLSLGLNETRQESLQSVPSAFVRQESTRIRHALLISKTEVMEGWPCSGPLRVDLAGCLHVGAALPVACSHPHEIGNGHSLFGRRSLCLNKVASLISMCGTG